MVCSCCGKPGHSVSTCQLPGAAQLRKLKSQLRVRQKQQGRRPPRMGSVTYKQVRKNHTKLYSGALKQQKDLNRRARAQKKLHDRALPDSPQEAVKKLQAAGWLSKPGECPHCGMKRWSQLHVQKFTTSQAYYRCLDPDCQMRVNAMKFLGNLLRESVSRNLTPQQLLLSIHVSSLHWEFKSQTNLFEC